jgi:glycerate dehydrogenase
LIFKIKKIFGKINENSDSKTKRYDKIKDKKQTMTKIVFLDRDTIGPSVQINRPKHPHEWIVYDKTTPNQVIERLSGADIAITNKVPILAETLEKLTNLKMICVAATGYNVVDTNACSNKGIIVSNVRGYAINTVPEHTFSLILALRRNLMGYRQDVIDGLWQKSGQFCFFTHSIQDLNGTRLGIIGRGLLGLAVEKIGLALGMDVVFAARKGSGNVKAPFTPFDEVIATSDVITLHLPLTPASQNLISQKEFQAMKRTPILINTARGGLVNEKDLVAALDNGSICAAGFDVLTSEPPKAENPLLKILERPNVIITPHIAWASEQAMQTLWDQVVLHIDNFLAGQPSNIVT